MEEEKIIYENEIEIPENWETNTILYRDGKGNVVEQIVPDDIEEG